MSGGHWDYQDFKLQEQGQELKGLFDFLAAAEHELDWGICCDTCLECAKKRVAEGLIRYFDGDVTAATAVVRVHDVNQCDECAKEGP